MLKDVVASSAQGALAVWLLSELSLQKALDKKKKKFYSTVYCFAVLKNQMNKIKLNRDETKLFFFFMKNLVEK